MSGDAGMPAADSRIGAAYALILAWAAALALIAIEWTRTPLSGPGRALLVWSVPAAPLAVFTWAWLRRVPVRRIPVGTAAIVALSIGWLVIAGIAAEDPGAEWLLDGLILRRPLERAAGVALRWAPGVWGTAISMAGLAAALEARWQLAHGGPKKKTPPPEGGGVGNA